MCWNGHSLFSSSPFSFVHNELLVLAICVCESKVLGAMRCVYTCILGVWFQEREELLAIARTLCSSAYLHIQYVYILGGVRMWF